MSRLDQTAESAPIEAPQTSWNRARIQITFWRVVVGIGLLAAWQLSSDYAGKIFISSPFDVVERIVEIIDSGELWRHSLVTFEETLYGYCLGAIAAITLPFVLRLSPRLMTAMDPYMAAAMAVPKLALAPLIILWFGIGILSKVLFVASLVFFLIFFNVLAGVLAAEAQLVQMARVVGAREWLIAREVVWNSALPSIFTGLKVSLPRGISSAVVAEFLAADAGLGYYIEHSRDQADTVGIFTGVVVVTIYVLVLNAILGRFQLRALKWRPVDREMQI